MTQARETKRPPAAILGLFGLALAALVASWFSHTTGIGVSVNPVSEAVETRDLRFVDEAGGSVAVYDSESSKLVTRIPAGEGAFVRGVCRALVRSRRMASIDTEEPFRLVRWADGRLTAMDPMTGDSIELIAFGIDNYRDFERLFEASAPGFEAMASDYRVQET